MKYLTITFVLICLFSCKESKYKKISEYEEKLDSLNIYDNNSYINYHNEISKIRPTKESFCLLDSLKAELDIKKGILNYFIGHDRTFLPETINGLPEYLKSNYSINSIELLVGCIVTDDDKYYECYERLMHQAIIDKFGNDFIPKSKRIVDSVYVYENPKKLYSKYNSYGMQNRYYSQEYKHWHDSINKKLRKNLIIPKDYVIKNDNITLISANFIINRFGKIDSLVIFSQNLDEKYNSYFEHHMKESILNTKWKPIQLYGINLNTKESFTTFL